MSDLDEQIDPGKKPPLDKRENQSVLSTQDLMAGLREIIIEHAGEHYRLRITRRNKLILQK